MTVKLASLRADLAREVKGDWVEYPLWPGVAFNVSSLQSSAYLTDLALMTQRMARAYKRSPVPPNVQAKEIGKLYATRILHGWRGLDEEYSPERAMEILTDESFRAIRDAVEWCAAEIGKIEAEYLGEEEKNSEPPSAGD